MPRDETEPFLHEVSSSRQLFVQRTGLVSNLTSIAVLLASCTRLCAILLLSIISVLLLLPLLRFLLAV